jgi:hypothetical protein
MSAFGALDDLWKASEVEKVAQRGSNAKIEAL